MNSSQILKTFNNQLEEFLNDMVRIMPENSEILTTQTLINQTKKINPKLIIEIWYTYVFLNYGEQINNNNFSYFIDKDYTKDLQDVSDNKSILESIEKIKTPIKNMAMNNRNTAMKYIQNLTKLSEIYVSLKK